MDDQNTKQLRSQLKAYLIRKGIDPDNPFRCLNPGHEDRNPSMTYYEPGQYVKCWSCGAVYSLFDLLGLDYGLTSFKDQKAKAADLFPIGLINEPTRTRAKARGTGQLQNQGKNSMFAMGSLQTINHKNQAEKGGSEMTKTNLEDQGQNYKTWHNHVNETDYWDFRGITRETINRFNLGYDPKRKAVVIPCTSTYYVARAASDNPGPRYLNMKGVPVQLFNEAALDQLEKPVWVTEGAIDALTLLQSGSQALALNSANMADKLIDAIEKRKQIPYLILCLDKDQAGQTMTQKTGRELQARNKHYMTAKVPDPHQDTNSMLQAKELALLDFVKQTEASVKDYISGKQQEELKILAETAFSSHLETFFRKKAKNVFIPTGFETLDKYLGGGLHEGLIVLGAQPSLGKTTLALQIANQAAAAGSPVIFVSLEQSISELIQKSISMYSQKELTQWDVKRLSADQIPLGDPRLDHYGPSFDKLFKHGDLLHVIEDARDVSQIGDQVFRIMSMTGTNPLVIIDYLQVIQPDPGDVLAEKRHNIDFNVTELKRLSKARNVPVLVISSLNRQNYDIDISMTAFKESGGIEYSSDLLLGLQFAALDPDARKGSFDHAAEMKEAPRKVQVKIIKQRDGMAGNRVNMDYWSAFNLFEESSPGV